MAGKSVPIAICGDTKRRIPHRYDSLWIKAEAFSGEAKRAAGLMSNFPDFDLGNGDCNFTTLGSRP